MKNYSNNFELKGGLLNKKSILNIEFDLNKNLFPKPSKKQSVVSSNKISDKDLSRESKYLSQFLSKNLKIPIKKKKHADIEIDLKHYLHFSKMKKVSNPLNTKTHLHFSNRSMNYIIKRNCNSQIINKKKYTLTNSLTSLTDKLGKINSEKNDKNIQIKKLYYELISQNYWNDISKDIINKNGGFRKLFLQKKLSDSEQSNDEVIQNDSYEKYIIRPYNYYYVIFKCFIFIIIFYFMIIYPICFAFNYNIPFFIQIFIEFFFFIDLLISFFVTFYDEKGDIVMDLNLCIFNYLTKNFLQNIIITFSSPIIFNTKSYFKLLPLIRIFKFNDFVYLEKNSELFYDKLIINLHIIKTLTVHNPLYSFVEFFISFFILLHISTCIFILLINSDYPNYTTIKYSDSNKRKYISGFYFSLTTILTVGYGDVTPINKYERLYSNFLMIIGVCLYSCVLSILSSLFEDFQNKERDNKKNFYILNDIRDIYNIPNDIYNKVLRYLKYSSIVNSKDNKFLINSLPKYYKSVLLYEIHGGSLNNLNFFKEKSIEFKFKAILFLKELNLIKGEYLIQTGDITEEFFMIKKGIVQIQKETIIKNIKILKIREKEHFGLIYMTSGIPMPFDILSYSKICELFFIKKSDFIELYEDYPNEIEKILNLSWKNTIRVERKAKMLFKKVENEFYSQNLNIYSTNEEKQSFSSLENDNNFITKNNKNKLSVIHEEIITYDSNCVNIEDIKEKKKNDSSPKRNVIEDNTFSSYKNNTYNQNNKLDLNVSNGNINLSNESPNQQSSKNKNKIRKTIFQTEFSNSYKLTTPIDEFKLRRSSSPVSQMNDFKQRIEKKNKTIINNKKKNSNFHLPLINFNSEKNKENEKSENNSKTIRNSKISVLNNNDDFINLNNNINNINIKKKDNNNHRKTESLTNIIQNLKGISEKLKNPTTFFSNNLEFGKKNKNLNNSNNIKKNVKNEIENMKENIVKIDNIYEKLLESIIKKLLKRNLYFKSNYIVN